MTHEVRQKNNENCGKEPCIVSVYMSGGQCIWIIPITPCSRVFSLRLVKVLNKEFKNFYWWNLIAYFRILFQFIFQFRILKLKMILMLVVTVISSFWNGVQVYNYSLLITLNFIEFLGKSTSLAPIYKKTFWLLGSFTQFWISKSTIFSQWTNSECSRTNNTTNL